MTWADKLFENTQEYVYDWRRNWSKHPHIENKYLISAVLEKNKEIREIIDGNKMPEFNREQMEARAFRELVSKCEEVKKK